MALDISRSVAGCAARFLCMGMAIGLLHSVPAAAQPYAMPPQAQPTAEDAVPESETAKLNEQQQEFVSSQYKEHQQAQRTYEEEVRAREEGIAQQQAEYEAAKEKREREYAEAMAKWKADVEACKAGDKSKCAAE